MDSIRHHAQPCAHHTSCTDACTPHLRDTPSTDVCTPCTKKNMMCTLRTLAPTQQQLLPQQGIPWPCDVAGGLSMAESNTNGLERERERERQREKVAQWGLQQPLHGSLQPTHVRTETLLFTSKIGNLNCATKTLNSVAHAWPRAKNPLHRLYGPCNSRSPSSE